MRCTKTEPPQPPTAAVVLLLGTAGFRPQWCTERPCSRDEQVQPPVNFARTLWLSCSIIFFGKLLCPRYPKRWAVQPLQPNCCKRSALSQVQCTLGARPRDLQGGRLFLWTPKNWWFGATTLLAIVLFFFGGDINDSNCFEKYQRRRVRVSTMGFLRKISFRSVLGFGHPNERHTWGMTRRPEHRLGECRACKQCFCVERPGPDT